MRECCSTKCVSWDECFALDILHYMKVLPLEPSEHPNKPWCKSFEKDTKVC